MPKLGERIISRYLVEGSPQRIGYYVETRYNNTITNPGVFYMLSDRKGKFWDIPRDAAISEQDMLTDFFKEV